MAENVTGGTTPRNADKNPRSLGAVRAYPPYWGRPFRPKYRGKCVKVMRTLVKMNVDVASDNLDQDIYRGGVVTRWFRPPR